MRIIGQHADLRAARRDWHEEGRSVGLVPTMGALHEGHLALVRRARAACGRVAVSLFVNPTQFGPNEDLARYPRSPEEDMRLLGAEGVDLLYMPADGDMYEKDASTTVHVGGITDHLCGPFRPGHFDGVATVVAKLLLRVMPDAACFGEKDWQQLQVIRRLARDLDIPARIIGVPVVREADGLALSSRNRYLPQEERAKAVLISQNLKHAAESIRAAPGNIGRVLAGGRENLEKAGFRVDYFECADAESCAPARDLARPARLFAAARLGSTRLIDNWPV